MSCDRWVNIVQILGKKMHYKSFLQHDHFCQYAHSPDKNFAKLIFQTHKKGGEKRENNNNNNLQH